MHRDGRQAKCHGILWNFWCGGWKYYLLIDAYLLLRICSSWISINFLNWNEECKLQRHSLKRALSLGGRYCHWQCIPELHTLLFCLIPQLHVNSMQHWPPLIFLKVKTNMFHPNLIKSSHIIRFPFLF